MSGIMMIAIGLLFMSGSFSLLLVSYAPPTTPIQNVTNFTEMLNTTLSSANFTAL
jgi:hypothetical protein